MSLLHAYAQTIWHRWLDLTRSLFWCGPFHPFLQSDEFIDKSSERNLVDYSLTSGYKVVNISCNFLLLHKLGGADKARLLFVTAQILMRTSLGSKASLLDDRSQIDKYAGALRGLLGEDDAEIFYRVSAAETSGVLHSSRCAPTRALSRRSKTSKYSGRCRLWVALFCNGSIFLERR